MDQLHRRHQLTRLRNFCLEEQEMANTRFKELMLSLELRGRLRQWLQSLCLENLPVSTVKQLRKTTRETVQDYIQNRGAQFIKGFENTIDWDQLAILIINRLQNSTTLTSSLIKISEELAFILERYFEEDLEKIVAQTIPILSIDQVIINRVNATTPENLEIAVKGIVKNELQAIVTLGGILGFMVGVLQTLLFLLKFR